MSITLEDLESFNEFVTERMRDGKTELSLEECLWQWRETRELLADVQLATEQIKAGQWVTLEECKRQVDEFMRELDRVEPLNE